MSDKSKICAIGEKKLIDGKWHEKGEALAGCIGCDLKDASSSAAITVCKRPDGGVYDTVEDGGSECHRTVWVDCDPPTGHEIKLSTEALPVEECAGCRYWKGCGDIGDCRRSSPAYLESVTFGQWPTTKRGDWCGEWKA